jgi:hypothetical protein
MNIKRAVPNEVVRRDLAASASAPEPMPSEHVISLLGSGEWALVVEALAMGDTEGVRPRRRTADRGIAKSERDERGQ